jgi:hypothetical protein
MHITRRLSRLSLLLLWLVPGCDDSEHWQKTVFDDEAALCLHSLIPTLDLDASGAMQLESGDRLKLYVESSECFSGSCTRNEVARCEVTLEGNELVASSHFEWEVKGGECTLDCGQLFAECETPPLPAGSHTLRHGKASMSLEVPGSVPCECLGMPRLPDWNGATCAAR